MLVGNGFGRLCDALASGLQLPYGQQTLSCPNRLCYFFSSFFPTVGLRGFQNPPTAGRRHSATPSLPLRAPS